MSVTVSFDRAADYYDATRGYPPGVGERVAQALLAASDATPETRILELGVGTGRIALPIIRAGFAYTGIDISPRMMERLRAALPAIPGAEERVTLVEGDITALPFPDSSFDVVLTVHVYHLLADRARVAAESARVLARPGLLLNGRDTSDDGDDAALLAAHWRESLTRRGWPMPEPDDWERRHSPDDDWQQLGATIDTLEAVEGETTWTPAGYLEGLARRQWSNTWAIPDAIFEAALGDLRAWAQEHYGAALSEPQRARRHFHITRGRLTN